MRFTKKSQWVKIIEESKKFILPPPKSGIILDGVTIWAVSKIFPEVCVRAI